MSIKAAKYIEEYKKKKVPYEREIMGVSFIIENTDVYPPGKLTNMFCKYLVENDIYKDKVILDLGCGSFALGIIGLKNGAKKVIGVDINPKAVESAISNLNCHIEKEKGVVIEGEISSLLPNYQNKIDVVLSGMPWDVINQEEFMNIDDNKKLLSRAFYDIDNMMMEEVFSESTKFLKDTGEFYITSCDRIMERINKTAEKYNLRSIKVCENDLHQDGNIHYILKMEYK